ncbi:MAG: hypothetical protein AABM42_06320, partial [Actinomycetota bacterium]
YDSFLGQFLLVGMASAPDPETGRLVTGIYSSVSDNLVNWSRRRLVMAAPSIHSYRCGGRDPIGYPSVLDPGSQSRTFETAGQYPYLYYTQFNYQRCRQTPNRDLVRVPLEISK